MKDHRFRSIAAVAGMAVILTVTSFVWPQDGNAGTCFKCAQVWSDDYGYMHEDFHQFGENKWQGGSMHELRLGTCAQGGHTAGYIPPPGGGGGECDPEVEECQGDL